MCIPQETNLNFFSLQDVVDHHRQLREHSAYRLVKVLREEAAHACTEPERREGKRIVFQRRDSRFVRRGRAGG